MQRHIEQAGLLRPTATIVLILVGALALREVAQVVLPVLLGLIIALVASPMIGALERQGVGHSGALAGTITVVLAVVVLTAGVVAVAVGQLVVLLPRYETGLTAATATLRDLLAKLPFGVDAAAITTFITPEKLLAFVQPVASAVSDAGGAMLIVAFTVVYAIAGGTSLKARLAVTLGEQDRFLIGVDRFAGELRRYLVVRARLGLFAAVFSFALLLVVGVPYPLLWSILVFAASFIPNIGAIIALVPPTVLAFLEGGLGMAAVVIVGYGLINFAQDQLLQPLVMGSELNLSPLAIFVAVVVWAWILGPAGALVAVPLTVAVAMILEAFPSSRTFASVLRDKVEPAPGNDVAVPDVPRIGASQQMGA